MSDLNINRHFKREAKIMIGSFVVIVLLGFLVGFLGPHVIAFFEVDRCLDAGGSFDYESCSCDFAESHSGVGK